MELVHLVTTVDAQVDHDPRDQILRHAAPPSGKRRAVEVSIEARDVCLEAAVMRRPLGQSGLELDGESVEEPRGSTDIRDNDVDRSESRSDPAERYRPDPGTTHNRGSR